MTNTQRFLALIAGAALFLVAPAALAGYGRLPLKGCPARYQFGQDHIQALKPFEGCGDTGLSALSARVVRGGAPKEEGISCLKRSGFIAVIDLRAESEQLNERERVTSAKMEYHAFPMSTGSSSPSEECTARGNSVTECNERNALGAANEITRILRAFPEGRIFVHCARGEDRTGLAIGLFRLLEQRCASARTRSEMKEFYYTPYEPLEAVWRKYAP